MLRERVALLWVAVMPLGLRQMHPLKLRGGVSGRRVVRAAPRRDWPRCVGGASRSPSSSLGTGGGDRTATVQETFSGSFHNDMGLEFLHTYEVYGTGTEALCNVGGNFEEAAVRSRTV